MVGEGRVMFKTQDIREIVDLVQSSPIQSTFYEKDQRTAVAALVVENRKAAAMERIADALTAIASKSA
jgi:hypothetical protein